MYEYRIKGEGYLKGEVREIGQATVVTVNTNWLGKEVVVIREPEMTGLTKILNIKPKTVEKTNAELIVEILKNIATKYSEDDIDNAVVLLKNETESANEISHKIMKGEYRDSDIQGEKAIERLEWMRDVSRYMPLGSEETIYELYNFTKEEGISREETIKTILTGVGTKPIIIALDWMAHIAKYSPLTISDMIAHNLYNFAFRHGYSKENIISLAGMGWDSENIIRLLNEKDENRQH